MTSAIPKHNIQEGQIIYVDDKTKKVAVFPGKKTGEFFTKAYKREGVEVLVTDPEYKGSGLIVFINDADHPNSDIEGTKGTSIKITKVLPNVVFGVYAD